MAEDQRPVTDPISNSSSGSTFGGGGGDAPIDLNNLDAAAIEEILRQASFEDPDQAIRADARAARASPSGAPAAAELPPTEDLALPNFQQVIQDAQVSSIDLLRDVDLNVKIELGRSRMLVEDVLKLGEGSVVELDKLAGDPVDVFVNERLVARGEVLVLNDNFCVRINEIVAGVKDEGL
jgi:flagellar motor switch protein FliN